ncbi:zinc finger SWIM domain-containing protein 7 isoform X2 [Manihot esculenta]|uniref:SWIM-type domain-containing protein n=1 Tax=Manihot esculenta TaxID=3983 RepID=A0A2C9VJ13_MANES|nr:zinc finger SWIM domain-containing protein 7 isoform X2 [Manihot esculenta]OAY45472.1 hypothetical protein MANES_07G063400v8 [Manihot esculenta]
MSASSLVAESLWKTIESTLTVTEDQLSILHFLFGKNFESATRIVDQRGVCSTICLDDVSGYLLFSKIFNLFLLIFSLHFLFGKNFERATRIVDQRGVKRISGEPSGRSIFQVVAESQRKEEYFCFPEQYCACYSFFYDIVNRGEQLCCKHQLAARLAAALGTCVNVRVSDEQLALLLVKL